MQSLSIWDVIFDNERLLLKGQGFLWNHLLALGLAQLASTLWLAVQIEHLRQRVEAHEQELQPDSNASGTRSFRSECSVLRNPQAAFFGLDA